MGNRVIARGAGGIQPRTAPDFLRQPNRLRARTREFANCRSEQRLAAERPPDQEAQQRRPLGAPGSDRAALELSVGLAPARWPAAEHLAGLVEVLLLEP